MKRKTSITKIASILTMLAMVWGGVACQQPTEPVEPTKYTISFDSDVKSITVEEGAVATEPTTAPEKTGYKFGGWLNGEAAYDWTQPVTSNLSLTAKWTAVEYTITYLPEGVEKDTYIKSYTIESDAIVLDTNPTSPDATKPNFVAWHDGKKPTEGEWVEIKEIAKGSTGNKIIVAEFSDKEQITITIKGDLTTTKSIDKGSAFKGETGYDFFEDEAFKTKFDLATVLDADKTLYAQAKTYTVTFDSGVEAITVKYNETAKEPTAPTKDGFDFVGWYEGETKFDFATKITKDISLTAKWEEKKAEDPTPPAGEDPETPAIPTTVAVTKNEDGSFSFADGTYTFVLEEGTRPVLKFSMPEEVSCTIGDKLKLTGKINFGDKAVYKQFYIQTNDTAGVPLFGYNMLAEWSNGLSGDKSLSLSQTITDTYCKSFKDCKFVLSNPMTEGDKTLINIELKDVVITYEIPDPNAEEVIFDTPQEKPGNVDFAINQAKFDEYIAAGKKTIVFTVKNTADASRGGWGCLAFISQETTGSWAWHQIVNNTDLETNEYGQISFASLEAGATAEKEFSIELLKKAVTDIGETNQLALQTSNEVILQSIKIK